MNDDHNGALTESGDGWQLPLAGLTVTRVSIDFSYTLLLAPAGGRGSYDCQVEGPFVLSRPGREDVRVVPEVGGAALAPALEALHHEVVQARATTGGLLTLVLTDGLTLRVPPGDAFEAWNVSGPDGFLCVSGVGGDITIWDASPRSATASADLQVLLSAYAVALRMGSGIDRDTESRLHAQLIRLRDDLGTDVMIDRATATLLTEAIVASWATTVRYSAAEREAVEQSIATLGEAVMAVLTPDHMPPLPRHA